VAALGQPPGSPLQRPCMTRVTLIDAWLAFGGAVLCLLGVATPLAVSQEEPDAGPPKLSRRAASTKHTWHSGPATTPPQTEKVPLPLEAPPPAKSRFGREKLDEKRPNVVKPPGEAAAGTNSPTQTHLSSLPASTPGTARRHDSPTPEAQRIRLELNHLREDSGARRAFYDELRRTLERVRAGQPDDDSQNSNSPDRVAPHIPGASGTAPKTPATDKPDLTPPRNPKAVRASFSMDSGRFVGEVSVPAGDSHAQASLVASHGKLDRAAYLRVVRNAKSNGAPVPLALGVAWIESHLQTNPPRGAAGEVGMFQILPERCRIEGWPPKRLKEPEFNAWLGTMLLARYYREEGSWARAAAKYVAGPGVFDRSYSEDLWAYINWYARSVESYAGYFSRYLS
jgi:hypothetical protein